MRAIVASLSVAVALATGCASTARAPEEPTYKGPNPGAEVAKGCGAGAIGSLKAGLIGVPIGATILVVCMPIAAAAAVIHEVVPVRGYAGGADSGEFAYPDGSPALRTGAYVNGGRGSSYGSYPDGHQCFRRCW